MSDEFGDYSGNVATEENKNTLLEIFRGASFEEGVNDWEISAAWRYDRKTNWSYDKLGSARSSSYGSENDDFVMQVTILVPFYTHAASRLREYHKEILTQTTAREIAELDAKISAMQAEKESLLKGSK